MGSLNRAGSRNIAVKSEMNQMDRKRFYLDVEENQRGRFIKIAEISTEGRKNQILMTFPTAALFNQNLIQFIDFYRDMDKLDPDNLRQGELKSEVMYNDDKKYHMDLKENARGRFLKVSEITRGHSRFQVFIPADGMVEFQHNLGELVDEHDNCDAEEDLSDPQNNYIRIGNKRFYLDVKENKRGRFIKIVEISAEGRRNQIQMTFSTAALFNQNLIQFIEFYGDLDKLNPDNLTQGELKSKMMYKDDKKYHMDLKENARGRFLKVSETLTRDNSRFQVFIPADGMGDFQHNLRELIDEYGNGDADYVEVDHF